MTKQEFLSGLEEKLSGLPEEDIRGRLTFYSEMIDDRIEDGIPEEFAIMDLGSLEEIKEAIRKRDELDKNKKEGSLKIAEDATYIDTSDLTIDNVCEIILSKIHI